MDYFPHAVTYAMGTVKNNKHLDEYFKRTRILESKKKIKYEDSANLAEYYQKQLEEKKNKLRKNEEEILIAAKKKRKKETKKEIINAIIVLVIFVIILFDKIDDIN